MEIMNKKLIYVCSKYSGNVKKNTQQTIEYCRGVYNDGHIPIAPHLYFTRFLDDTNPDERKVGMELGQMMLKQCDEMWVFGSDISSGMMQDIEFAKENNIPVIYIEEVKLDWMIKRC